MLSFLVFFPLAFGAGLLLLSERLARPAALFGAAAHFVFSCALLFLFEPGAGHLQLTEKAPLIPFLGVQYFLGVDGLSLWYVLLSAFLLPAAVFHSQKIARPAPYFFLLFSLVSLANGAFLSFDGVLFYLFFEMSLLPLFFLIYLWGGRGRAYAAFKFLIYTFFASMFLLGGLVALMLMAKISSGAISASLLDFYRLDLVFVEGRILSAQSLLFFCFAIAFAAKTPVFPFHTWLPLAHVEAPAAASAFLAAVVLKMGTYGWLRFVLPLFPEASAHYSPLLLFLAAFGLIYTSLAAFAQTDMKKLVAYSSVAHMAYVLLGIFAFNQYGLAGGFYQTLTHAVSSAALFLLVGTAYERAETRAISDYGGLAKSMPRFAVIFFIITLSAIALPFTGGFVSEFLVLLGSYVSGKIWVWPAALGVILSAAYMLRLFGKVFLSEESRISKGLKDLSLREAAVLAPFAALTVFMGVFPGFFFKYSQGSLDHLSRNLYNYELSESAEPEFPEKLEDDESKDKKAAPAELESAPPESPEELEDDESKDKKDSPPKSPEESEDNKSRDKKDSPPKSPEEFEDDEGKKDSPPESPEKSEDGAGKNKKDSPPKSPEESEDNESRDKTPAPAELYRSYLDFQVFSHGGRAVLRGIPPHGAGGYMRPGMAVPERQPSLHERLKEINYADFSNQTGIESAAPLRESQKTEGL